MTEHPAHQNSYGIFWLTILKLNYDTMKYGYDTKKLKLS